MENEENKELENKKNITSNDDNNNEKANKLCLISLALALLPNLIENFLWDVLPEVSEWVDKILSMLGICFPIAFIMMIYIRIKYPKNTFGKVLMIFYIIAPIVFMVCACFAMVACFESIQSCPG